MTHLRQLLTEKKKKVTEIYIDPDPQVPYPDDSMSIIKKELRQAAKDLDTDWGSAVEVVDFVFKELNITKPMPHLKKRWEQYLECITIAVKELKDARGFGAKWTTF